MIRSKPIRVVSREVGAQAASDRLPGEFGPTVCGAAGTDIIPDVLAREASGTSVPVTCGRGRRWLAAP